MRYYYGNQHYFSQKIVSLPWRQREAERRQRETVFEDEICVVEVLCENEQFEKMLQELKTGRTIIGF